MTRALIYSPDTYGLGHLRRCTLLAGGVVEADPDNEVVIVTGSPRAQAFVLPERVDTIKLPAATKGDGGGYRARTLRCDLSALVRLRSELLLAAMSSFDLDVIVVDHAPIGMAGELMPVLRRLATARSAPRLVLGLRDIVDEAARVERSWASDGTWEMLGAYDDILVYGDESTTTTATELELERRLRVPIHHTGYVAPAMPEPAGGDPFVLVTAGGGGDGHELVRRYLDAVECGALAGIRSVIVTGPLMSADRRAELIARAESTRDVTVIAFSADLRSLISSATAVVSMAGYNTVVEELAAETPALLVPRSTPRLEQDLRARRLEEVAAVERCPLAELDPGRLAAFVDRARAGSSWRTTVDLGGTARAAAAIAPRPAATNATTTKGTVCHV
ncbi:MAG TPA: glycosyltransferase [Acidimicrobiales bacterium]|nr:glycosyltransferase [Acidimicrobiales bacterium]